MNLFYVYSESDVDVNDSCYLLASGRGNGRGILYGSQGVAPLPSRASFPPYFSKIVREALVLGPLMPKTEVGGKQGHALRKN